MDLLKAKVDQRPGADRMGDFQLHAVRRHIDAGTVRHAIPAVCVLPPEIDSTLKYFPRILAAVSFPHQVWIDGSAHEFRPAVN